MSKWLVIAGSLLGLLTVVLVNLHIDRLASSQKSVALLRLKPSVSLTMGQRVALDMLQTEEVPERFRSFTKLAISDSQESRAWIDGRPVTRDVAPGTLLLHEHFADEPRERFPARIATHKRAIAIPVTAASAVNYFIEPGSRVDILGTFESADQQPVAVPGPGDAGSAPHTLTIPSLKRTTVTKTILQNVRVLAVGRAVTRGNYLELGRDSFSTVTVEVSGEDAEKLLFAISQVRGGLTLVLRNPEDQHIKAIPSVSWDSLNERRGP
jgi:Flp pilus assembly protein CpaB